MTRVLLLGSGGLVGTDLVITVPPSIDLVTRTRSELDITDRDAVERAMHDVRPNVVVNAAGYTNVDQAEVDREQAFRVNGEAPGLLGRAAAGVNALVLHYSTDYIFNGRADVPVREDQAPDPLNQYGLSKLEGERTLAASGARHLIVRTQWVFGTRGRSFPRTMWERAKNRQKTRVVNDQFGRPTFSRDLAAATWRLLALFLPPAKAPPGVSVLHIANTGVTTWYEMARRIFRAARVESLVEPCTSAEVPRPARRPARSALDTSRYDSLGGRGLPTWEDALDRFLGELEGRRETAGPS